MGYLDRSVPEENNDYESKPTPKPFRRRKNEIMAVRVSEDNVKEVAKWCGGEVLRSNGSQYITSTDAILQIPTLHGVLDLYSGEWLVRSEDGRYTIMENKEFIAEYEYDKSRAEVSPISYPDGARTIES